MTRIHVKLIAVGTALLLAVGYLGVTGAASGWVYFVDVDKYLADPALKNQRVRLHGKVAADDFVVSSAGLKAEFRLAGASATLPVVYNGTIPEMFAVDREVVVEGRMDAGGRFKADVLMTKCASKYEAAGDPPHGTPKPASIEAAERAEVK